MKMDNLHKQKLNKITKNQHILFLRDIETGQCEYTGCTIKTVVYMFSTGKEVEIFSKMDK